MDLIIAAPLTSRGWFPVSGGDGSDRVVYFSGLKISDFLERLAVTRWNDQEGFGPLCG